MLANEEIDLLSIVTPDHLHADSFVAACEAGVKGIYCEKPISTTLEDADRMIAAAEASGTRWWSTTPAASIRSTDTRDGWSNKERSAPCNRSWAPWVASGRCSSAMART
ncbi:MAG: Gfo/Idh/MocA family oxidoreductase [Thermomicrobiales bacterium]